MNFDELYQPNKANRYCITARNGMVATGSALASQAGLDILKKGGNAVDAAVATAAALTVVEPTANGLGSDAFAIVWMKDQMYGLNASGYSPKNISLEDVRRRNPDGKMPVYGWTPVMVPGAVKGWAALVKRFGNLSLEEDLQPAIRYAEEGYPLSPMLASMWKRSFDRYHAMFDGKPEHAEWFRVFTDQGRCPHFGDLVKLPDHAKTLRLIAATDSDEYYKGEIADQIVRQSERDGGYFCKEDFTTYDVSWVDPISVNYRGYDVWEIPPNGQGITALMALNILKNFDFSAGKDTDAYHKQFEAMKLAFADAKYFVTDPKEMKIDYHALLDPDYGKERASLIQDDAALPCHGNPPQHGTVYLCTADHDGNMVSMIQSNYMGFGSGITVEGYGITLQNRGADFSLTEGDANVLAPHKKSYHTIIPGFLTKDGKAVGPFGVMGGYMQPQGHVQVVMNMIDFHLNPQQALDAPRWQWTSGKKFLLEPEFDNAIAQQLAARGHEVSYALNRTSFGRGEIILRLDNGTLVGGTESRTDANIAAW